MKLITRKTRALRRSHTQNVRAIRQQMPTLDSATDAELVERTLALRERVIDGSSPVAGSILVPAFALLTESLRRSHGIILYDVQLLGGQVLSEGAIAEMQTGEGKTFVASLPAFLHGLAGRGVHVATTNSYLAERDCEEVKPALERLGLTVGQLKDDATPEEKQAAYACDITYGTGYEFGFDFLRDQLTLRAQQNKTLGLSYRQRLRGEFQSAPELLQKEHAFAVVDEADSVLIDEATTPLVLSGSSPGDAPSPLVYQTAREIALLLDVESEVDLDAKANQCSLTKAGTERIHEFLKERLNRYGSQLAAALKRPWHQYVEQALRAEYLLQRDVHYVVRQQEVQIVDQNTGRIFEERSWRAGLHQAVETKERVPLSDERQTQARVSRQRYFQLYDQICGMTGTAQGNEKELSEFYGLDVIPIPTNRPSQRVGLPLRSFRDHESKYAAIVDDVIDRHATGQPILIGTKTIEQSQTLSAALTNANLPHLVLNGMQDATEADVISFAGKKDAITIATNMAGRGTDIKVSKEVEELGGLHVIGVEHHESTRVDRQLVGRAARQGQRGSCQFFLSAEDELLTDSLSQQICKSANANNESSRDFAGEVATLQKRAERDGFERRQQLIQQDTWLDGVLATLAKAH